MARSDFSRDPPSWLLKLLLSVELGPDAAGASFPALPGRGVERADGTSSASMPKGAETPLVMRSSSPCGCVTVILVGGLVSGVVASARAVAERFRELVRAAGAALDGACVASLTGFSSSPRASSVFPLDVRRVEMGEVPLVPLMLVLLWLAWTSSGARAGERVRRVRLSVADCRRGRATLAIMLLGEMRVSPAHLSGIATLSGH